MLIIQFFFVKALPQGQWTMNYIYGLHSLRAPVSLAFASGTGCDGLLPQPKLKASLLHSPCSSLSTPPPQTGFGYFMAVSLPAFIRLVKTDSVAAPSLLPSTESIVVPLMCFLRFHCLHPASTGSALSLFHPTAHCACLTLRLKASPGEAEPLNLTIKTLNCLVVVVSTDDQAALRPMA